MRSSSAFGRFEDVLYPFGFAVRIVSSSRRVVEIARQEWGAWRQAFDDPPIEVSFYTRHTPPGSTHSEFRPAVSFEAHRDGFRSQMDARNWGWGETGAGKATAHVDESVVEDKPYFVYYFLEAFTFHLITSRYFMPMHAGSVAKYAGDLRAVLLAGNSGEGKSSLSYACARAGWIFVSDDASPILRRCADARLVVGSPHHVRLRPDARELFPELARFEPAVRGNGKLSLQIPTRELAIETAPSAYAGAIVLPRRVSREPSSSLARLKPIGHAPIRELCEQWFYHWDPPIYREQQNAFAKLLAGVRTFELEYSDLNAAVEALNDVV